MLTKYPIARGFLFLLPTLSVLAEISQIGVVGGPFHGLQSGPNGKILSQAGAFANFAYPEKLITGSASHSIPSGGSTAVSASIALDDDTFTELAPSEVFWSFDNSGLSISGSSLFAEALPEKRVLEIRGEYDEYHSTFVIIVLADEELAREFNLGHLPEALRSAIELEAEGWRESTWFGVFFDARNGWIYHADLGWLHAADEGPEHAWFWNSSMEWLWTGNSVYPHLYRNRDSAWLYFFKQAKPEKVFYNHQTELIERDSEK